MRVRMLFITLMTKCLIQICGSVNKYETLSLGATGHRLGDDRLEVLVLLVAPGELLHITGN